MATDYDDAIDATLTVLKALWDTESAAIVGAADPVLLVYEEAERDLKPHPADSTQPWARVVVRHATGRAAALGRHRFRRTGTVYVQAFVPNDNGLAKGKATGLARIAQKAYEMTRGTAVSFKNATVTEKGPDGNFYRADCTAEFWWDELR